MNRDAIIKSIQMAQTEEDMVHVLCDALNSLTLGDDSLEMRIKQLMVKTFCMDYLGNQKS